MAKIYIAKLNDKLKKAIVNHELSDEQIGQVYDSLKAQKKKNKNLITFLMIFLGALFLLMGGAAIAQIGDTDVLKFFIPITIVAIAVIWVVCWYATIGRVSNQWNRKLSKYYPAICEQYKL